MRTLLVLVLLSEILIAQSARPRARDLGIKVGVIPTGLRNAITDVAGVAVGHATVIRGWRHKGLRAFFETGSTRGIRPEHTSRLWLVLADSTRRPSLGT